MPSKEVQLILARFKQDYGKSPFVEVGDKKLVEPNFMFFVVNNYLELHKSLLKIVSETKAELEASRVVSADNPGSVL